MYDPYTSTRTIINVTVKKCHKLHHFESFFVVENLGSQAIVARCAYKIGSGHAGKDEQITMCAVPVPGINHFWNILGHGHG